MGRSSSPTVGDALRRATEALQQAGVAQPGLEATLLVGLALNVGREWLLAHPEQVLSAEQRAWLEQLLARRLAREPMAYIRGEQEFYGRSFLVTDAVLIPRPETELLVEVALQAIDRAMERGVQRPRVADVGTGSGAIAITVALERPAAGVVALDIEARALAVARRNALRLGASVRFVRGDLLAPLSGPMHVLLANLPYVPESRWATLQPELHFEPRLAVLAGPSGTELIECLLQQAIERLAPRAEIVLEFDEEQGERARSLATRILPAGVTEVLRDYAGMDRILHVRLPRST